LSAPAGFVGGSPVQERIATQFRILVALIMRDVQTRFFGTPLGFIIAILWPVSHIFILIFINKAAGRAAPYGDDPALFFATGLLPFMCFNYMSRFTMMGVMLNKPLLGYPIVKVGDILIARATLEVLNATVVTIVTMLILTALGTDVIPPRPQEAMYALMSMMLLGLGFGIVNGVIAGVFPFWFTPFALFQIVLWIASGVIMVPDELPQVARYWLSFNPALIGVEWMRSAFYEGYGLGELLDKRYMLGFSTATLFIGLLMERAMRGRILRN
jgi:capsular polysaccharide transport system permease protein